MAPRPRHAPGRALTMLPAVAGLLSIALVLAATFTSGPGVSPDSAAYLSAAESVAAGRGYVKYDDDLYVHLPPLYPTVLAAVIRLGVDALTVARLANAVALGGLVWVAYVLLGLHVRSRPLIAFGIAAVVLSPTLLSIATMVWTETLFTVLLALVALGLRLDALGRRGLGFPLALACAALACLLRYAGLFVVAGAVTLIMLERGRFPRLGDRAWRALLFAAGALAPVTLWVARNVYLTTASRLPLHPFGLDLAQTLHGGADAVTGWAWPPRWPLAWRLAATAAVILAGCLLAYLAGPGRPGGERWKVRARVPFVLTVVYAAFMLGILLTIHYEAARLLVPMYLWVLVIALVAMDELLRRLRGAGRRGRAAIAVIAAASIAWLGYQGSRVARDVMLDLGDGVGPYRRVFERSPTVQWVRATRLDGTLYSNAPEVIYLFTGKPARLGATRQGAAAGPATSGPRYLVWFDRAPDQGVLAPAELPAVVPVATLADGAVYRLTGPASALR